MAHVRSFLFSLCLGLLLFWSGPPVRAAARLPLIEAPVVYSGEYIHEGGAYRILLCLENNQSFMIREIVVLANGKVSRWEVTGKWHQIRNRAFLQLTNNSSYQRLLNVGGEADLYLDVRLPEGGRETILLRPQEDPQVPDYPAFGLLRRDKNGYSFTDGNSGMAYPLPSGGIVEDYAKRHEEKEWSSLPVQVTVGLERGKGAEPRLLLRDIKDAPEDRKWEKINPDNDLLQAVTGSRWLLARVEGKEPAAPCLLEFLPGRPANRGRLDMFDGTRHVTGSFALDGDALALSAEKQADAAMARLLERVRSWKLAGEVLELWDTKQMLAVLEKMQ